MNLGFPMSKQAESMFMHVVLPLESIYNTNIHCVRCSCMHYDFNVPFMLYDFNVPFML